MKVRIGFVSNSSSSSFVMIGMKYKWNPSKEEMIQIMEEHNLNYNKQWPEDSFHDYLHNGNFGFRAFNEPDVIGYVLAEDDSYSSTLEEKEFDIDNLEDVIKNTKHSIKKFTGIDAKLKLITGTRCT